jgi:hypothetical protein
MYAKANAKAERFNRAFPRKFARGLATATLHNKKRQSAAPV